MLYFSFWDGFAPLKKNPLSIVKDTVWHEASKGHPEIPHVPFACHLWGAQLLTEERVLKIPSLHTAVAH
jgi:hypothetical protein